MWQTYGDTGLHIVFGDTQISDWNTLNGPYWRTKFYPNLTYWLSIDEELGSKYGLFGDGYVPYNAIIGPGYQLYRSESGFYEEETYAVIDKAQGNFAFYPQNLLDRQLIPTETETRIDLSNVFYNSTGETVSFSLIENSDPDVCTASLVGNELVVTGNSILGDTRLFIKGTAGDKEGYFAIVIEAYDPVMTEMINENYETAWPPAGWTVKGPGAGFIRTDADSHSGSFSACHADDEGAQNDWLYTPKMTITENTVLTFWQRSYFGSYYSFHGVAFSKDMNRFTWLNFDLQAGDSWEKVYVDLSSLDGQDVYLGFNYQGDFSDVWLIDDVQILTGSGIEDENLISGAELEQNYPNPFNPSTEISINLNKDETVRLTVYNIKGETSAVLYNGPMAKGHHNFTFDATEMNSGIYFYTLETPGNKITRKMLLVK